MTNNLALRCEGGREFSLSEKSFFEKIEGDIHKGQKNIPLRQRKKYKLEVVKKAQEYTLRLIDVKADKEIQRLQMHASADLQGLEVRLLTDLTKAIERHTLQAALDIQRDFKDAKVLGEKIDPDDEEFIEVYLKDLRNVALGNLKDISRLKERGID